MPLSLWNCKLFQFLRAVIGLNSWLSINSIGPSPVSSVLGGNFPRFYCIFLSLRALVASLISLLSSIICIVIIGRSMFCWLSLCFCLLLFVCQTFITCSNSRCWSSVSFYFFQLVLCMVYEVSSPIVIRIELMFHNLCISMSLHLPYLVFFH